MRNLNIALFLRQALKPVEPIGIILGSFILMAVSQRSRLDRNDFAGGKPKPSSHYGMGDFQDGPASAEIWRVETRTS
jgi:hypothetical protein